MVKHEILPQDDTVDEPKVSIKNLYKIFGDEPEAQMEAVRGGMGKPEPLKGDLSGWWSRRLDREHRLVYRAEDDRLLIAQCRYHY